MDEYPIGSTAEAFYDIDGNPCTLRQLVVKEPDWAVSRINRERQQTAALEIALKSVSAALERAGVTECDDPGEAIDVLVAELAALRGAIKAHQESFTWEEDHTEEDRVLWSALQGGE